MIQVNDAIARIGQERMIASIKSPKQIEAFLRTDVTTTFLMMGTLSTLDRYVAHLKRENRTVFLHAERINGISLDRDGIDYLAKRVGADGIVTTKASVLQHAKRAGLLTVQRLFLVDSDAVTSGLKLAEAQQPDAIELMPGLIPSVVEKISREVSFPIVTGGMIRQPIDVHRALDHGAFAVSTGDERLWHVQRQKEELA
ncbi:glycerol-3-phosphate responsive antiterminator [Exiguobacterium sp. MER 193]|uniref:glycerol-3-phosphate responsive antiterminator n=1 Tax=Exiguobacterium sp. MER 193 TaxID=2939564 RepID=UPI0011C8A6A9|nr:glycerol-3-phosphate responsive antiterminator [Exiguobacterium sp. MER 193]MCM3280468.1 glycerol-3-phosphate responsive antiterminator [Exiguobacterium sp. MER 193]